MRFMMLVKHPEISMQPPEEFLDAMNKLNEEATKSGAFQGGGALKPTAASARVRLLADKSGQPTGRSPKPRKLSAASRSWNSHREKKR